MAERKKTLTELVTEMRNIGVTYLELYVGDFNSIECGMQTNSTTCDACGHEIGEIECEMGDAHGVGDTVEEAITGAVEFIKEQLEAESDD